MEDPTNKDLMHYISDIRDSVNNIKEKDLPEINGRVKTTNGSVADIKAWKERITGAAWAFGILFTVIILPLVTWAFIKVSNLDTGNIDDKIEEGLNKALQQYEKDNS